MDNTWLHHTQSRSTHYLVIALFLHLLWMNDSRCHPAEKPHANSRNVFDAIQVLDYAISACVSNYSLSGHKWTACLVEQQPTN